MIKVGDTLPNATLMEYSEVEGNGCSIGPNPVDVSKAAAGKTIAIFGLPGAYTPTCSAKHVPGFKEHAGEMKAKGVDAIVCLSVNDAFVMKAWGENQGVMDTILMVADPAGDFTKALGLEMDASKFGLGLRSQRYSMLVDDGVVKELNVEAPGEFKVSAADYMLAQL